MRLFAEGAEFFAHTKKPPSGSFVQIIKLAFEVVFAVGDDLPDDDMRFIQIITYSLGRVQEIAAQYGLSVEEDWSFAPINQQIWLKFKKQEA